MKRESVVTLNRLTVDSCFSRSAAQPAMISDDADSASADEGPMKAHNIYRTKACSNRHHRHPVIMDFHDKICTVPANLFQTADTGENENHHKVERGCVIVGLNRSDVALCD